MTEIVLEKYFARIGFTYQKNADEEETLKRLHRCHSFSIPFECLDPLCGVVVPLSEPALYKKVVEDLRGGYCFELNKLFFLLLENLGFQVKSVLCRPFSGEGLKLPLTHRMSIVTIGETLWLADVGLGGNGWIEPLRFVLDQEQEQYGRRYLITQESETEYLVKLEREGGFVNAVAFGFQYAEESDFEMSHYFTSTYPDSPFVNRMMCTLPTENGRYTIRDSIFKIENGNEKSEISLTKENVDEIYAQYFGITLSQEMRVKIHHYLDV